MPTARPSASITIDAPLQLVWEVMLDTASYAEWNPFVERAETASPAAAGNPIVLHVRWANGRTTQVAGADQRDRAARHDRRE